MRDPAASNALFSHSVQSAHSPCRMQQKCRLVRMVSALRSAAIRLLNYQVSIRPFGNVAAHVARSNASRYAQLYYITMICGRNMVGECPLATKRCDRLRLASGSPAHALLSSSLVSSVVRCLRLVQPGRSTNLSSCVSSVFDRAFVCAATHNIGRLYGVSNQSYTGDPANLCNAIIHALALSISIGFVCSTST